MIAHEVGGAESDRFHVTASLSGIAVFEEGGRIVEGLMGTVLDFGDVQRIVKEAVRRLDQRIAGLPGDTFPGGILQPEAVGIGGNGDAVDAGDIPCHQRILTVPQLRAVEITAFGDFSIGGTMRGAEICHNGYVKERSIIVLFKPSGTIDAKPAIAGIPDCLGQQGNASRGRRID